MASHMTRYFELLGMPLRRWSRSLQQSDGIDVGSALEACGRVLLLVSDAAIEPVVADNPALSEKMLIHFSGSLSTPVAQGMHPLCTFGTELYDLETYRQVPFVCERGKYTFEAIFPHLPNPTFTIDAGDKPLYHALAVLAGNFTYVLWTKLFSDFESRLGLPREAAIPYLRTIASNLSGGRADALTGPLTRGDSETVAANLAALQGDPFQDVYRAFVQAIAPDLLRDS